MKRHRGAELNDVVELNRLDSRQTSNSFTMTLSLISGERRMIGTTLWAFVGQFADKVPMFPSGIVGVDISAFYL